MRDIRKARSDLMRAQQHLCEAGALVDQYTNTDSPLDNGKVQLLESVMDTLDAMDTILMVIIRETTCVHEWGLTTFWNVEGQGYFKVCGKCGTQEVDDR